MSVKLLMEHCLEFLSLIGSCNGSSESTLVKMPYCPKSHVAAQSQKIDNQINGIALNLLHVTYQGQQLTSRVELH